MDIQGLIKDLKAQGVSSFEGYGIKIEFHRSEASHVSLPFVRDYKPIDEPKVEFQPELPLQAVDSNSAGLAQSLDGEVAYDKILNWSASPDASEIETPLTGDASPLTSEG